MSKKTLLFSIVLIGFSTLSWAQTTSQQAAKVTDFLNSIGVVSSVSTRGESVTKTIECLKYTGIRWIRVGRTSNVPVQDLLSIHQEAGTMFSYGIGSSGSDITGVISVAKTLASVGALIAVEGPNEPNGWGITYQGETGGGRGATTWLPVAKLQRDLYQAVKSDDILKSYPVFGISEVGAEVDNVGLQYLTIPAGAGLLMSDGTKYADYANCHNYIVHPSFSGINTNQTWRSADPSSTCPVDGLTKNHGKTWLMGFTGYTDVQLDTLPRVTTETGTTIHDNITEDIQAYWYVDLYLSQFKRNWSYTSVYLLRDRSDEAGNQTYGFYTSTYTPRKSAVLLHNLTTILADDGVLNTPGQLAYSIVNQPVAVHDLLLQKSNGTFELVIWGEKFVYGSESVTVNLGKTYETVKIYDITVGTSPVQTLSNVNSVSLTLSKFPYIIEVGDNLSGVDKVEVAIHAFFVSGTNTIQLTDSNQIKEISLYSLTGNLLFTKTNPEASFTVSNLNQGTYILKVKEKNGTVTSTKIVKI